MRKILTSKKGSSSLIYTIAILIFLCVLTLGIVVTMQFRSLALELHNTTGTALEEYIVVQARENMDSIKNGHNYLAEIDEDEYIEYLANALGVNEDLQGHTSTGRSFEISNIELTFDTANTMNVTARFELYMPLEVSGVTFPPLETTLTVHSELASKF